MSKFDKWWYEHGSGFVTPGGDEEDAAKSAWEDALKTAVEEMKKSDYISKNAMIEVVLKLKEFSSN